MKPENAQSIIDALHVPDGILYKRRYQKRTTIREVSTLGNIIWYKDGRKIKNDIKSGGSAEFVTITTENIATVSGHLAALGALGYLVTDKPADIDEANTDPHLELISHSNPDGGTLTESVFLDHNPNS